MVVVRLYSLVGVGVDVGVGVGVVSCVLRCTSVLSLRGNTS